MNGIVPNLIVGNIKDLWEIAKEIIIELEAIVDKARDNKKIFNSFETAQKQFECGQYTLALLNITKTLDLLEMRPINKMSDSDKRLRSSLLVIKGLAHNMKGEFPEAIRALDKSTDAEIQDPSIGVAWNNKGLAQSNLNMYDDAIKSFDLAINAFKSGASNQFKQLSMAWNNKGNALWQLNRYEEAIRSYNSAIERNPMYASIWSNKGIAFDSMCEYEKSLDCFKKANEVNPLLKEAWYNQGLLLYKGGHYEESIKAFQKAIDVYDQVLSIYKEIIKESQKYLKDRPSEKDINTRVLDAINASGPNFSEAFSAYDKLFEQDQSISDRTLANYWFCKGIAFYKLGGYDEANGNFDKAIKIFPDFIFAWIGKGKVYYDLSRYLEAFKCYNSALEILAKSMDITLEILMIWNPESGTQEIHASPEYPIVFNHLGKLYNTVDYYEDAIRNLKKAVNANPGFALAWENLGISFDGLNQFDDAIIAYDNALIADSSLASAWFSKGITLKKTNKHEESILCFAKAIEKSKEKIALNSRDVSAWIVMGDAFSQQGKHNEAIESYMKCIKTNPKKILAWKGLSEAYCEIKNYDDAVMAYNEILDIDPLDGNTWYNKGIVLKELGRDKEAETAFIRAKEQGYQG